MYIVQCTYTLCNIHVHCTVYIYIMQYTCTLYSVHIHYAIYMYIVQCTYTLCNIHVHCTVYIYIMQYTCTLYSVQCTLYIAKCVWKDLPYAKYKDAACKYTKYRNTRAQDVKMYVCKI